MFVQVIEGRTNDAEALAALGREWQETLRPGATGYLGVTAGTTADGRAITIVRFDSPESARANSERPEQTEFFTKIRALYDGDPVFTESTDVEEFMGGVDPSATFVQVMKVSGVDRVKVKELDAQFESMADMRPDLLGGFRIWTGPDSEIDVNYFTSEAEARAGESKELPPEAQALMAEFGEAMSNTEWIDLTDPFIA